MLLSQCYANLMISFANCLISFRIDQPSKPGIGRALLIPNTKLTYTADIQALSQGITRERKKHTAANKQFVSIPAAFIWARWKWFGLLLQSINTYIPGKKKRCNTPISNTGTPYEYAAHTWPISWRTEEMMVSGTRVTSSWKTEQLKHRWKQLPIFKTAIMKAGSHISMSSQLSALAKRRVRGLGGLNLWSVTYLLKNVLKTVLS